MITFFPLSNEATNERTRDVFGNCIKRAGGFTSFLMSINPPESGVSQDAFPFVYFPRNKNDGSFTKRAGAKGGRIQASGRYLERSAFLDLVCWSNKHRYRWEQRGVRRMWTIE